MRVFEIDEGHWRLELEGGLGLEVILLFSRSLAFWRYGGALVRDAIVGDG